MTRYARARGSNAAPHRSRRGGGGGGGGGNSFSRREPEEATSWAEMRAAMVIQRPDKAGKRQDNPEAEEDGDAEMALILRTGEPQETVFESVESDLSEAESEKAVGMESRLGGDPGAGEAPESKKVDNSLIEEKPERKKNKANIKCLNCRVRGHLKMECPELPEERRRELQELVKMKLERKGKGTGRKKNKKKKRLEEGATVNGEDKENPASKKEHQGDRKNKKGRDFNKKQRPDRKDKAGQLVQRGEGLFQGFRVKEEDAARLKKLREDLGAKGLKGEELEAELKKERRRAEKELARFNKTLCYNCRRPGHLLSECPQARQESLKKDGRPSQQQCCYKCGSSEHTSRDCASKRKAGDAFAFATCFICGDRGHLAKACPDNPRGLYPKGGGCRFCGSVEHLKSDCPRKIEKDTRQEVRADRMHSHSLEVEEAPDRKKRKNEQKQRKPKKVVNF